MGSNRKLTYTNTIIYIVLLCDVSCSVMCMGSRAVLCCYTAGVHGVPRIFKDPQILEKVLLLSTNSWVFSCYGFTYTGLILNQIVSIELFLSFF